MRLNQIITSTAVAICSTLAFSAQAADITGAGSSFVYPAYSKWAESYKAATGNNLNYQSIGSGAGIKQIIAKTVDFGASDLPLSQADLDKDGLTQFPAIVGGVTIVVNLDGVKPGQLKLTGQALADIYNAKVTKWNDKEIADLNPGVKLPATDITAVYRADSSGTTYIVTSYMSKVSPEFKTAIGSGTAVKWPAGIGGKGNEGVAANVQKIKGAIGYVEYAYVKENKMTYTQMKNADGQFVSPDEKAFAAAATSAEWAKTPGFAVDFTNASGKTSWPITAASFIIMHKSQEADGAKGKEVLKFFDWALKSGAADAAKLDYVPLPAPVVKLVQDSWKANLKDASGKAIW
ncbi:phosphate ABC transporter substrate-binding protein PstS [Oxalobacteraceae bacterium CAVE-383]|nr:phosphate ABC transporter substrate-binding protein PstS [Oxalobacteraceae bacterium CAVE-383]